MKHLVAFFAVAFIGCAATAFPMANEQRDREIAKERDKLLKEDDPVDRAKIGIKISDLLLASVSDAVESQDFSAMNAHLDEYALVIRTAHTTMMSSGRDAQKKPAGFKELEIALRKHVRRFEDLARALSLERRVPIETVKGLASNLQDGLLKALFAVKLP